MYTRRFSHLVLHDWLLPKMYRVAPIPMLEDNYCWRISNPLHKTALIVDVAQGREGLAAARAAAAADGCELVGVLCTHYHADHSGGHDHIAEELPGLPIFGGVEEEGRVRCATTQVTDGQVVELPGFTFQVLHTPCHTRGHVCYHFQGEVTHAGPTPPPGAGEAEDAVVPAPGSYPGALFTGDTLFSGGCGRFFEGTAAQMTSSLAKLKALPPATLVYCGHEYTVSNLQFGAAVEPGNADIARRLAATRALRAEAPPQPTVPSTLAIEARTNVFLRTGAPGMAACAVVIAETEHGGAGQDEVEVMAALRIAKNKFKAM